MRWTEPCLTGVDVAIIHVRRIILFIANCVFPKSTLLYPAFATCDAYFRAPFRWWQALAETLFDQPLSICEIVIAGWTRPYGVQVIR